MLSSKLIIFSLLKSNALVIQGKLPLLLPFADRASGFEMPVWVFAIFN